MFGEWFLTHDVLRSHCLQYRHNALLVALSYVVAAFAAYTAFHLIERVRAAKSAKSRQGWLAIASISMGLGTWAMHFVAMLAVEMPIPIGYDVRITALSAGFAICASWAAFSLLVNLPFPERQSLLLAGSVFGAGIALMHYLGMSAVRMAAHIYYDPWLFGLSAVVAVALSTASLYAIRDLPRVVKGRPLLVRLISSAVMGFAVALMHYTGMLAAVFHPEADAPKIAFFFDSSVLAILIGASTLVIVGLALIAAIVENDRKQSPEFTAALINSMPGFFALLDQTGCFTRWNANLAILTGLSDERLKGLHASEIIVENERDGVRTKIREVFTHGFASLEFGVLDRGGEVHAVHWTGRKISHQSREYLLAIGIDVTDRKRAEEALQASETKYRDLFESTRDAIMTLDSSSGRFTTANPGAIKLFGANDEAEFISHKPWDYSPDRQPDGRASAEKARDMIETAMREGSHLFEWTHKRVDGTQFPADVLLTRVIHGAEPQMYATVRDVTERKHATEQITRLALYDTLTGLANRRLFIVSLQQMITRTGRSHRTFAVLYLDLDHFKDVNDTLGRSIGDLLLQAVADRLRAKVREVDTVARFGGDEFAIILTDIEDPAEAAFVSERTIDAACEPVCIPRGAVAAGSYADKILEAVSEPFLIEGNEIYSGATIGIAVYGPDSQDPEAMLSQADLAQYHAKSEERGTYRLFTDAIDTEVRARVKKTRELREAIGTDQLFLMYQPQIDIGTGCIVGLEALVRWRHPALGVVGPDQFIPAAEKNGLIVPLGARVIRTVCHQIKQWLDAGIALPVTAINISGVQFKRPLQLESDIAAGLADYGVPAELLELELTESVLMKASLEHNDLLIRLRKAGLRIAIDDFGSGYSSLDYLRRYTADRIKIDQTFTRDIGIVSGSNAIMRAALGLARELGMEVVVEGVETAAQLELLKAWGCCTVQGYYFAKPLSVPEISAMLQIGKITPPQAAFQDSSIGAISTFDKTVLRS